MWMAHIFYDNLSDWQIALNADKVLALLDVDTIVTAFPPYASKTDVSFNSILVIMAGAISESGSFTDSIPAALINELFTSVESTRPESDQSNERSLLKTDLNYVIAHTLESMAKVNEEVFNGDLTGFPPALTSGDYTSPMANFFSHGRFVFQLNTAEQTNLRHGIAQRLRAGIVGQALVGGNYFWVKNSTVAENCDKHRGIMVDGVCNTLKHPAGFATQDTLDKIKGFGVNLTDLFTSSEKCQKRINEYYGAPIRDILRGGESQDNVLPCFYNLTVVDKSASSALRPYSLIFMASALSFAVLPFL